MNRLVSDEDEPLGDRVMHCLDLHSEAEQIFETTGTDKETYAQIVYAAADFLSENGGDDIAMNLFFKHLQLCEELYGPDSLASTHSLSNIGATYLYFGKKKEGLHFLIKSLEIREKRLTPGHPDIVNNCLAVGIAYKSLNDLPHTIDYFEKAKEAENDDVKKLSNSIEIIRQKKEKHDALTAFLESWGIEYLN